MSATRNPFYQLPGNADIPGDVRVSDTADGTKTAAGGWAASPVAVAETQTHHKYTGHSAETNVTIFDASNYIMVTGKNVDVYLGVNLSRAFNSETVIKNVPKPVSNYTLAAFVNSDGVIRGFGWISPGGNIASPSNLGTGKSYIVAHYTTY